MALAATSIFEVWTTGSDTLNGGIFDPGQTAGMYATWAIASSNTSSPVLSNASVTFTSASVNAWFFLSSGTNSIPAWYKIVSVDTTGGTSATLNAAIGAGVLKTVLTPTTALGCSSSGTSLSSVTGSIDFSQQAATVWNYTDLTSTGAGLTATSAAHPFLKEHVGNSIITITGTNITTANGRFVLASVSGVTGTFVGPTNVFSGAGAADGTGGMGGALISGGLATGLMVASNMLFIKTGTYAISSATINISGGCLKTTAGAMRVEGYGTVRGDLTSAPLLQAGAISTFILLDCSTGGGLDIRNITVDGALATSSQGIKQARGAYLLCRALNCTNSGFLGASNAVSIKCSVTGCTTQPAWQTAGGLLLFCESYSNAVIGFNGSGVQFVNCLAYANSGASSDGFVTGSSGDRAMGCVSYGNGLRGFQINNTSTSLINCIAEGNTAGTGFNFGSQGNASMINCAVYNNSTNVSQTGIPAANLGLITGTSTFFISAAGGNFALNNTSTGGGLLRAAGFPGTFPAGTSTGYLDIGAVQHQDSASGSIFNVME